MCGWRQDVYERELVSRWLGRRFRYEEQTDSTNSQVRAAAAQGTPEGLVIAAGSQSAGRGRRGRSWDSPADGGLYFSLLLRPDLAPAKAPMLTLAAACSAGNTLREDYGIGVQVKWPNDLVLGGRKICGILTEMSLDGCGRPAVTVGIGVNVANRSIAPELAGRATSLYLETGQIYGREELLARLLNRLEQDYERFLLAGSLEPFREEYEAMLVNKGRRVRLEGVPARDSQNGRDGGRMAGTPGGEAVGGGMDGSLQACRSATGIALGITGQGELLVQCDGEKGIRKVNSGEVSVRGLYGYI